MQYILHNKYEKPAFSFLVKINTSNHDYYLFTDFEKAAEKARILSISEFPLTVIYEPIIDKDGEWHLHKPYYYMDGKCYYEEHPKMELHAKFYTDAGQWLNPNEPLHQ